MADLEVDEPIERAAELARRWAAALVLARAPAQIAEVPLAELALDGPRLCAQALRALLSDAELDRLTGHGGGAREGSAPARRLAAIAGAADAAECIEAAEILRGILWEALEAVPCAAREQDAVLVADRLAHVCAAAAASALSGLQAREDVAQEPSERPPRPARRSGAQRSRRTPLLVDESQPATAELPPEAPAARIQIRDARGDGSPPWIWAIGRELDRFTAEGEPFSVLLAELMDHERIGEEEPAGELERLGEALEHPLLDALRRQPGEIERVSPRRQAQQTPDAGWLTRERPGRYWIVAAGRDRHAAQELADRLVHAAAALRTSGGRAIALGVGTASCPQDGRDAQALAAHADVGLHAARAAFRAAAGISAGPV